MIDISEMLSIDSFMCIASFETKPRKFQRNKGLQTNQNIVIARVVSAPYKVFKQFHFTTAL